MSTVKTAATNRQATHTKVELLEKLEDFGLEIDRAMAAIAGNRLQAFEQSVRRQESACDCLSALAAQLHPFTPSPTLDPEQDSALNQRLRAATSTIRTLNARYSALLRHSGQSLRLLASLSSTASGYAGCVQFQANQPKQQTWSCEV